LAATGCEKDEVRHYTVDRPPPPENRVRLLAAIISSGDDAWFFKLVGPVDVVEEHQKAFAKLLNSLRPPAKASAPLTWTAPEGWTQQEGGGDFRVATLRPEKGKPAEVTVSKLGKEARDVLPNVNRWRRLDLGLRPVDDDELGPYTKALKVGDLPVVTVDMVGPGPRRSKKSNTGMAARAARRPTRLTYSTPPGWTDTGARDGFVPVEASFVVREGNDFAQVKVTALQDYKVALLDDVNRWRDEVGLPKATQAQLDAEAPVPVEVDKVAGRSFDFTGPKARSLVVRVKRGDTAWFFKMLGPPALVSKHKAAYEAFIRSVKFNGGRGAADE
jgi:hypothetical protein